MSDRGPQKFVFFVQHKGCTRWSQKGCQALEKRCLDIVRRGANLWVLLKDGCGTRCTPFPNLFEINTFHTTMCSALKWSQWISGVALMGLAPIKMCQKNVLNVQNNLQAVLQLQYIKIAVVVQGAGDGKQVLGRLKPQLADVQGCRWVADLHHLYTDEEGLKSDLPPQIQACGYESFWYLLKESNIN